MRILIVGAGATGGYFGGRLAAAGRDVTFLVRPGRAAQIASRGLEIVSPYGDFSIRPRTVVTGGVEGAFDLVILTVKAFSLDAAMEDLAPAVGQDTTLLPILNGMRHVDLLEDRFGRSVIGGVCKVSTTLDAEGRILQLAPFQELVYGELEGGPSNRVSAADAVLKDCGFTARASEDVVQEMWDKWTMLASLGALTCLMRGTVGEIAAAPGGVALARATLAEACAVAGAAGHRPGEAHVAQTVAMLTTPGSGVTSSMFRDLTAGQAVEADHILGDLVARAGDLGVATPLLSASYANLSVYEKRRIEVVN